MALPKPKIIEARRGQMFPVLDAADLRRMHRYGEVHTFASGTFLAKAGESGPGMFVILKGQVDVTQRDVLGHVEPIVSHGPGSFMAEIATLSGSPALVDGIAKTQVEAIVIPTKRIRDLLVEEADLGERIMRALILRRLALIESDHAGPVIVGRASDANVVRLEGFLSRNGQPHHALDPDVDANAGVILERFHTDPSELPIVLCPNGQMLRNPSENQLARCLGLVRPIDVTRVYDVAIVGAGPAGLAASVYAASEGLSVITLDCRAFGGQAGASARIENYLGFPTGITGMALMGRAYSQAQKFGVEFSIPQEAVRLSETRKARFALETGDAQQIAARTVIVATGARYRRPDVANLDAFEGSHVHYWASPVEARLCSGQEVVLVGAGNSAGQAAVFLASQVKKVWLLMRGCDIGASMSRYLVDRIGAQPNIEVLAETELRALEGDRGRLERVRWRHNPSGRETTCDVAHVFLFIGAEPNADWLKSLGIVVDAKGFVCTSAELGKGSRPLETSLSGLFAIGDVRAGSVKRVASSVGEGAQVVSVIHRYLAETGEAGAR